MPGILVSDMIQRASVQADMVDGFVDQATWLQWVKAESIALEILLARNGWTQAIKFDTQTITTDQISVASGSDILAIAGVWELVNNRYRRLTLRSPVEFYAQPTGTGGITGPAAYFSVVAPQNGVAGSSGYTVNLFPRPTSGTYVIAYLAAPFGTGGVAPAYTDTVYYPLGFEEWIVLRMSRRALIKEESDTGGIDRLLSDEEQKIEEACWNRTLAETPSVRNVDRVARGWTDWIDFPPPIGWYWY